MPKLVDLRQDRNLICNTFDGYKLSLDSVPIIRQDIAIPPLKATPSDDQYSYLHAELFSMQNLLVSDPWLRTSSYFVNNQRDIIHCSYNENTGRPSTMQSVFRIPMGQLRASGDYNCTIKFMSEKFAVLCDGIKELYLFDTGDRSKSAEWKKVFSCAVSEELRNYALFDCRLDVVNEKKVISCALGRIARDAASHSLHLHWATLQQKEDSWSFAVNEVIEGKGSLYYCAFEPKADSIVISSNRPLKFQSKDVEPVTVEVKSKDEETTSYSWLQTDDDITVKFNVIEGKEKNDYHVKCTQNRLTVSCNDVTLLDKDLFAKIDQDLTTWSIENNFLQITLVKENTSLFWPYLVEGGPPEALEGNDAGIPIEKQPIPNLEAPIEDCDFPMGTTDNEIKIERLNLSSKEITHQIILGNSPPLFSTSLRPGFPLALATRQDVDACLWLQQYNPAKPTEWGFRHEGNLNAFGYVQASKQQKKFMDCAPDLSYAIICESHRHVFLYKAKYDNAVGLRNRSGPQISLGKQHLITLEDTGEVLGIATDSCVVTLLTEKCVLYLQIN